MRNNLLAILCLISFPILSSCSTEQKPIDLTPRDAHQVPVSIAVAPFNTEKLTYEDRPIDKDYGVVLQKAMYDALSRTNMFNEVILLNMDNPSQDLEFFRLEAKKKGIDLILVGEVEDIRVDTPGFIDGLEYDVSIKLRADLYHVLTQNHIWRKSDIVNTSRDGLPSIDQVAVNTVRDILRSVVVRSATVGLMAPLLVYLQNKYEEFDPDVAHDPFGTASDARIDEELAPVFVSVPPQSSSFAVVIGIEAYQRFPRVEYAIRDSEQIKKYLMQSLGYPEKNIVILRNEDASRSQMVARIERWLPSKVGNKPDARVFVYYGGHGTYDIATNRAYLVPYDGDLTYPEDTTYSLERLYEKLGKLPANQVTVVIDSCFSGVGGRSIIKPGTRANLTAMNTPNVTSPNLIVFTASAANEVSSAYAGKRHGLFTYFFLKGLQGHADLNGDGVVSFKEEHSYVRDKVETEARRDNRDQTPQLVASPDAVMSHIDRPLATLK